MFDCSQVRRAHCHQASYTCLKDGQRPKQTMKNQVSKAFTRPWNHPHMLRESVKSYKSQMV